MTKKPDGTVAPSSNPGSQPQAPRKDIQAHVPDDGSVAQHQGTGSRPRPSRFVLDLAFRSWQRFREIDGIDRAMGLASRAFVSILPLLLVLNSVLPFDRRSLKDTLGGKIGLSPSATRAIEQLVAPRGEVRNQLTIFGCILLLVSALSFMRMLQQLYERIWLLPPLRGVRGAPWGLGGVTSLILYFILVAVTGALVRHLPVSSLWSALINLAVGTALWLCIPYVVLARRITVRRLLPGAMLTAFGMTALNAGMTIYLPLSITSHVQRYGPIGVVFAVLYWFVAVAFVVEGAGVAGAVYGESEPYASRHETAELAT